MSFSFELCKMFRLIALYVVCLFILILIVYPLLFILVYPYPHCGLLVYRHFYYSLIIKMSISFELYNNSSCNCTICVLLVCPHSKLFKNLAFLPSRQGNESTWTARYKKVSGNHPSLRYFQSSFQIGEGLSPLGLVSLMLPSDRLMKQHIHISGFRHFRLNY